MLLIILFMLTIIICMLISIDSDFHRMLIGFAGLLLMMTLFMSFYKGKIQYIQDNNSTYIKKIKGNK